MSNIKEEVYEDIIDGVRVKTISVEYKRKLNLGNYESVELASAAWAELDPEVDPGKAFDNLGDLCRQNIRKRAAPFFLVNSNGVGTTVGDKMKPSPPKGSGGSGEELVEIATA